jgi:hypothetical protein
MPECFLCQPDDHLVYLRIEHLFAMLGHGPLGRGYSLIATTAHVPSMFDLDDDAARELVEFTERVRATLRPLYGEAVVTEHGRVAACVTEVTRRYEPHCLHAHRLVFPGQHQLDLRKESPRHQVVDFPSFDRARESFEWPGQYLYAENADGSCQVAAAPRRMPRQFFRTAIATRRGESEFANWQHQPRLEEVEAARRELRLG